MEIYAHKESGDEYLAAFISQMKHKEIEELLSQCEGEPYLSRDGRQGLFAGLVGMVNTRYSGIVMLTKDSVILFEPQWGYEGELDALEVVSGKTFLNFYEKSGAKNRPRIAGRQIDHLLGNEVLSGEELGALIRAIGTM